ncbi:MAG: hypothetical protein JWR14_1756 [Caballeronia sp.]|nr:hypothetical protein [Caballeronia sp.]
MLKIGRTGPGIKTTSFRGAIFRHIDVIASQYMCLEPRLEADYSCRSLPGRNCESTSIESMAPEADLD